MTERTTDMRFRVTVTEVHTLVNWIEAPSIEVAQGMRFDTDEFYLAATTTTVESIVYDPETESEK